MLCLLSCAIPVCIGFLLTVSVTNIGLVIWHPGTQENWLTLPNWKLSKDIKQKQSISIQRLGIPFLYEIRSLIDTEIELAGYRGALHCLTQEAEGLKEVVEKSFRHRQELFAKYHRIQEFQDLAVSYCCKNFFIFWKLLKNPVLVKQHGPWEVTESWSQGC